ncbi:MAG: preprotein translocase subunit SecE [Bacilli bacterium]|nr:preprotein translocase subunit SecE [Bacilli bacterium]MBO6285913.1 preprotein translocase subunit SecE [Bacilli bacterium]
MNPKKYMSEVVKEGKRIRWPKRDVLIPTIIVVVLIAGIAAIFLSLEDLAAGRLIQLLKDAFGGN